MSTSLPSREIVMIDVPEVYDFRAEFQYNFHVPDEGTSETGGVPRRYFQRPSDAFGAEFIQQVTSRIPRFVRFYFTPAASMPINRSVSDSDSRNHAMRVDREEGFIKDNLNKILDEDQFTSENFTSVNFNDQSIDTKIYNIVSQSAVYLLEGVEHSTLHTAKSLVYNTNLITSKQVDQQFLSKAIMQPKETATTFFSRQSKAIENSVINRLKDVNLHVQVNTKFFHDIVHNNIVSPNSTMGDNMLSLYSLSKTMKSKAMTKSRSDMIDSEYKTIANYVDIMAQKGSTSSVNSSGKVVGYVIDKVELLPNGQRKIHDPIVLENPKVSTSIDFQVKYYGRYLYSIRTVAEFVIPAIIDDTNELVVITLLVSSKPTKQVLVDCVEDVPPPPPTDTSFHWDYENNALVMTWSLPPNTQRDIKKFQVFRRKSIDEPFQLQRVYDFDDSEVKAEENETYPARLVERLDSPKMIFVDNEFTKMSKFIYSVVSIDAHGLSSNYGEQYELTFDRFKNKLKKIRVSPSGAPKPYPNMYLLAEAFLDAIVDQGHKTMTIVFDPDHLALFDSQQRDLQFLSFSNHSAGYKFLVINTDLQKQEIVNVNIEDRRLNLHLEKLYGNIHAPQLSRKKPIRF